MASLIAQRLCEKQNIISSIFQIDCSYSQLTDNPQKPLQHEEPVCISVIQDSKGSSSVKFMNSDSRVIFRYDPDTQGFSAWNWERNSTCNFYLPVEELGTCIISEQIHYNIHPSEAFLLTHQENLFDGDVCIWEIPALLQTENVGERVSTQKTLLQRIKLKCKEGPALCSMYSCFSPDGKFASISYKNELIVWNLITGSEVARFDIFDSDEFLNVRVTELQFCITKSRNDSDISPFIIANVTSGIKNKRNFGLKLFFFQASDAKDVWYIPLWESNSTSDNLITSSWFEEKDGKTTIHVASNGPESTRNHLFNIYSVAILNWQDTSRIMSGRGKKETRKPINERSPMIEIKTQKVEKPMSDSENRETCFNVFDFSLIKTFSKELILLAAVGSSEYQKPGSFFIDIIAKSFSATAIEADFIESGKNSLESIGSLSNKLEHIKIDQGRGVSETRSKVEINDENLVPSSNTNVSRTRDIPKTQNYLPTVKADYLNSQKAASKAKRSKTSNVISGPLVPSCGQKSLNLKLNEFLSQKTNECIEVRTTTSKKLVGGVDRDDIAELLMRPHNQILKVLQIKSSVVNQANKILLQNNNFHENLLHFLSAELNVVRDSQYSLGLGKASAVSEILRKVYLSGSKKSIKILDLQRIRYLLDISLDLIKLKFEDIFVVGCEVVSAALTIHEKILADLIKSENADESTRTNAMACLGTLQEVSDIVNRKKSTDRSGNIIRELNIKARPLLARKSNNGMF